MVGNNLHVFYRNKTTNRTRHAWHDYSGGTGWHDEDVTGGANQAKGYTALASANRNGTWALLAGGWGYGGVSNGTGAFMHQIQGSAGWAQWWRADFIRTSAAAPKSASAYFNASSNTVELFYVLDSGELKHGRL
jgi:hypothetical protein